MDDREDGGSRKNRKFRIYNPLDDDFSTTYDIHGDRKPVRFTIPAGEIAAFDNEAVARHLIKHLAETVVWSRGIKTNWEDEFKAAKKEVEVRL